MMKIFLFLCCLLSSCISFCQDHTNTYRDLIEKGRALYRTKDYKNAAISFSSAINLPGINVLIIDRHRAAFSWALANYPDSAFHHLDIIADLSGLTFNNIIDIITDEDYTPLYKDNRWQQVKDKMLLNAYLTYSAALEENVSKDNKPTRIDKEFINALGVLNERALTQINAPAYDLLKRKMHEKAYQYFKTTLYHFPANYILFQNMGDYYKEVGDAERSFTYYSRALNQKYKQIFFEGDTVLRIDSAIAADYKKLSDQAGRKALPSDYLLLVGANVLLQEGMTEKAYPLIKMNIENHPNSSMANRSMGDYFNKKGEKQKAEEYYTRSLILQHNLPADFFDSSFNAASYMVTKYEQISKQRSGKVYPPEGIINALANQFMLKKIFGNAEQLYKLNITNYPHSQNSYRNIISFYKATGNTDKQEEFNKQAEYLKNNPLPQPTIQTEVFPDTTYNVLVNNPVCFQNCPVIWFDEAHNNYHTPSFRYKPLANLLANDGFKIIKGKTPITKEVLSKVNVVIIAAPGPMSAGEINILNRWIKDGGSLFTVTDHSNLGFDALLESLGIGSPETEFTEDTVHARVFEDGITKNPRHIVFSENLLGNHPIINGRNNSEKIKVVKTFSGRTIIAPAGSSVILRLSETATDYMTIEPALRTTDASVVVKSKGTRVYGAAFSFGKGKVVVVSEAAMLTAQIWNDGTPGAGMNTPGSDNKQFALNIIRWLTGYLK